MKIKRRGDILVAIAETGDNEGRSKAGDSLGQLSIKTEKFTGNTIAMPKLYDELEKLYVEGIILCGYKYTNALPKKGDTMICIQKGNFNYGMTAEVKSDIILIDTVNWKVATKIK